MVEKARLDARLYGGCFETDEERKLAAFVINYVDMVIFFQFI